MNLFHKIAFVALFLTAQLSFAIAQDSRINYNIPTAVYTQASGSSNQLRGSIEYDDTTMVIENFSFDVPLFSFISDFGSYNYVAALGGAYTFPNMRFESDKIEQEDEDLVIRGTLYFRGDYRPLTIRAKRVDDKKVFSVDGNFRINVRDYILFSAGRGIPPYIDMNFRMVFDKTPVKA